MSNFSVHMTKQDVDKLLQGGERISLECKKALGGIPNSLWETYSAFANTDGGTILLGVEEDTAAKARTKRFSVTGVDDADKLRKDLWNILSNKEKVSVNLLNDSDISVVEVGDKEVIAIHVPRAEYNLRPVYINNNPIRGAYRRNHEGDYHCTEQMVRMMVRDSFEDGNDRQLIEYYTMDDIDQPTLKSYRIMFGLENPEHVWNGLDDKEFLTQLGGYTVNRAEHTEGLTMAGLLMFGKGLPVRERFDNLRMDYIDKSNLIGDQRYSDRLTYDGRWENNIFNFIRMVVPKLTRDLPRPFQMEGVVRKDDTPQHKAVREAFTNMIIHADLMTNGLLRAEKYDDRIVLTNPGLLKLPLEQIYRGGESKARNQRIQNMLRMIGYGENLGSGFPLILKAWNDKHWVRPELIEQPELMQVKLVLHIMNGEDDEPFLSTDDKKDDPKDDPKETTERQRVIITLILQDDTITREEMTQKTRMSDATIKRDLADLQAKGILTREGGRKEGRWVVNVHHKDKNG